MGNKFAEMLRLLLKKHHVQQLELAQNIGVKRTTISMYATGNSRPDIDGLIKIAQFFNVSLDYLMTGERVENRITREELGLSERALEILKQTANDEKHAVLSWFIDKLICDEDFCTTCEKICSELIRKAKQYPEIRRAYEAERRAHEDSTGEYQAESDTLTLDDYMKLIETRAALDLHTPLLQYFKRVNIWRYAYDEKPNEYFGETVSGWTGDENAPYHKQGAEQDSEPLGE